MIRQEFLNRLRERINARSMNAMSRKEFIDKMRSRAEGNSAQCSVKREELLKRMRERTEKVETAR